MAGSAEPAAARLAAVLDDCAPAAVAVSGGVDSMTLAHAAQRALGLRVTMFHAVSPAVPADATARVRRHACAHGWRLEVIRAGEFDDARYLANPANRCFFCKQNLYAAIAKTTDVQLLSGTNLDDLGDWRPGLEAAKARGVRHPYVEAGIDKAGVRSLARTFALEDLVELPAAPCLSSRVETGIPIAAPALHFVDAAEKLVRAALAPRTVRCRVRRRGIVVELDGETLSSLSAAERDLLAVRIADLAAVRRIAGPVDFEPYARGSAFVRSAS